MFSCWVVSDIGNVIEMIRRKLMYAFCLRKGKQIYAMYFFKDSRTQYEGFGGVEGALLQLVGSIQNSSSAYLLYSGFLHSLTAILKIMDVYRILMIEEVSHNGIIIEEWKKINVPFTENKAAYYFYNYVVPNSPFPREKTIFLI